MQILHDESFITISYDMHNEWLHVNWVGDQDLDTIQSGCAHILRCLKEKKCFKILYDNRGVTNRWSEASEWIGRTWIPEAVEAGLHYLAWVPSFNFESRVSAELTLYYANIGVIATFDNITEARSWLNRICVKEDKA